MAALHVMVKRLSLITKIINNLQKKNYEIYVGIALNNTRIFDRMFLPTFLGELFLSKVCCLYTAVQEEAGRLSQFRN
jgi:hypothetical protein